MSSVPTRREFALEITDHALKSVNQLGHPLSSAIVEIILKRVLVSEREWKKVWKEEEELDITDTRAHFEHQLRDALKFFPPDLLSAEDLPTVTKAVLIKYRARQATIWPGGRLIRRPADASVRAMETLTV